MTPLKPLLDPYELIVQGCRILDIPLLDSAAHKMIHHMELVKNWGAKINLTAIKDPREMAILHFLDSLTVFKVIPVGSQLNILDIGSGGGFPGLVLRMADETLHVTLLDRDPKKIVFLKYAARALNLTGVDFMNRSLKNLLAHPSSGLFDRIVSRGFSSNITVLDGLYSLLAPNGRLIIMTGPASKKLALKNFRLAVFWEGILPFSNRFRKVLLYQLNN
jgi:16S rRNA (guanine527-N7)-methyltransferase